MTADIVIIGAGGHAASVIDVINSTRHYKIVRLVDPKYKTAHGYGVLQNDLELKQYCRNAGVELGAIAIGVVFNWTARIRGINLLEATSLDTPYIVASSAYVSSGAAIGKGTIIHHGAIVNREARIGDYCIINTGAVIEHGVVIGNNTHIAPGAIVLGDARIGDKCLVGAGVVVPAGSSVTSDYIWQNFRHPYATATENTISSETKTMDTDTQEQTKSDASSVK